LTTFLHGFFDTLRIPLKQGRTFTDLDKNQTTPVAVINDAMARHFWRDQDPIGKRFHFFGDPKLLEVVGVVGNTVINQIGEDPQPLAYLPLTQDYSPAATLQVRTSGDPRAVIATVRGQIQALDQVRLKSWGAMCSKLAFPPHLSRAGDGSKYRKIKISRSA
jgi:putative ABC transport system permease protein